MKTDKVVIYQIFTRLFGNNNSTNKENGTIAENGSGKFNDITDKVLSQLKENGYTHIWYIGCLAHSSATSYEKYGIPKDFPEIVKGKAGSPYAVRDYYDVDPDLAVNVNERIAEFEQLVERTHKAGMKVIIDFVPNHLARNYKSINKPQGVVDFGENDNKEISFNPQNNFYYLPNTSLNLEAIPFSNDITYKEYPAKATGNDSFTDTPSEYDWYETVKLNYGVDYENNKAYFDPIPDTWFKIKDILNYWADKNVDGFRCDMAEMVPLEFWQWVIPQIKAKSPEVIFFAETYNPDQYRNFLANNNFDYLYDKVGLYDVLRDVASGFRPASDISFALNKVGDIQPRLINFIENHDEQRVASDYFLKDGNKAKAAMILTSCINSNPIMVYFGQELGERGMDEEGFSGKNGRTTIFDYWSVDSVRRWKNNGKWNDELLEKEEVDLKRFYKKLLNLIHSEKALNEGLYYDLMPFNYENYEFNSQKQFAFLRGVENELILVVTNFSDQDEDVKVLFPADSFNFFGIENHTECILKPLLNENSSSQIKCTFETPFKANIPANSGEIYKFSFS